MRYKISHLLSIFRVYIVFHNAFVYGAQQERVARTANGAPLAGVKAPLLGDEIDLETMEGVDQLTKLVLLKTDSLPGESDKLDIRYLNSLMETLYTGLRKPFKSVSADILGIFPTLEFLNITCELPNDTEPDRERIKIKRCSSDDPKNVPTKIQPVIQDDNYSNDSTLLDNDLNNYDHYKSSIHVCKAVTNDCLSMNDLVRILPPSIVTSNSLLVRLCPVILFRLMSNICHHDIEVISAYEQKHKSPEDAEISNHQTNGKSAISLNTLQMLKSLQNSDEVNSNKRPQKLHKKLKTRTNYKSNVNVNAGGLKQHGVDEQLLKIKLKLSEPSIEKVWIFSLLFVILSIVVSMGGLIVLPFVKKTTRRRILTLFEGLAVGGLTGSATLHMFPQAFGLVDENYHRYFWRIFVVFLGIYLCYLCERMIKILKVVRAKIRRRSRASLIDMDFRYGIPSISRDIGKGHQTNRIENQDDVGDITLSDRSKSKSCWGKKRSDMPQTFELHSQRYDEKKHYSAGEKCSSSSKTRKKSERRKSEKKELFKLVDDKSKVRPTSRERSNNSKNFFGDESLNLEHSMDPTRQRLIRCLKSVRSQFSPVYVVFNQPHTDNDLRSHNSRRYQDYQVNENHWNNKVTHTHNPRRNRLLADIQQPMEKPHDISKATTKRQAKHEEIETMLYHRNLMEHHNRNESNLNERYRQNRFSDVSDLAGERQDQNNPARMSVDTVSWMILFGDGLLNVIDGLSIGAAFERNILAGISISVAVMLEEVTHRLGTTAILIRTGFSIKQSFICTFLSACALFPGMIVGIMLSDATDEATPYIFCAAGGIFLYTGLVDVMKEMNRSIENAMRKDIKTTLKIFALQNIGIILAVVFLSFLALYEPDFEEYQKILNNN